MLRGLALILLTRKDAMAFAPSFRRAETGLGLLAALGSSRVAGTARDSNQLIGERETKRRQSRGDAAASMAAEFDEALGYK